ncbi:MAG: hypothetical protein Q7K55_04530 [Candidatus Levybacteria bacterium]|nr:hypothetical protein [Candidatus Levybacteria bacterium]
MENPGQPQQSTNQPLGQAPQQPIVSSTASHKSRVFLFIILGILVIFIGYILLIGFPENTKCGQVLACHGIPLNKQCLGYKSTFAFIDCAKTGTQTSMPTISPIALDETASPDSTPIQSGPIGANWKTYVNKTFNYSFKYPKDAKLSNAAANSLHDENLMWDADNTCCISILIDNSIIRINVVKSNLSLNQYKNYLLNKPDKPLQTSDINEIKFLGIEALRYRYLYTPRTILIKDGKRFYIDIDDTFSSSNAKSEVLNQILSNFTFLNNSQTNPENDLITYNNQKLNIEFKYPRSWLIDVSGEDKIKENTELDGNRTQINLNNEYLLEYGDSPDTKGIVFQINISKNPGQDFKTFIDSDGRMPEGGIAEYIQDINSLPLYGVYYSEDPKGCYRQYYLEQSKNLYTTIGANNCRSGKINNDDIIQKIIRSIKFTPRFTD